MSTEYKKGFDDAIDSVLKLLEDEISMYIINNLAMPNKWKLEREAGRASLYRLKLLINEIFKCGIKESA